MQLARDKIFSSEDYSAFFSSVVLPVVALAVFLMLWSISAKQVQTSLGQLPGPAAVFAQASNLVDEHNAERDKEAAFYQRQEKRNAAKLARARSVAAGAGIQLRAMATSPLRATLFCASEDVDELVRSLHRAFRE